MSAFEFFFSFYGLLLGFSVAELVGGLARVLHDPRSGRIGWLTPLIATFVAMDIATFWVQAWLIFRNAPFNLALLVLGLVVAGVFYVAASLVFPRETSTTQSLDEHAWAHRRLILLCVVAANTLIVLTLVGVTTLSGERATLLRPVVIVTTTFFLTATTAAALAPRRIAIALLVLLLAYQAWGVTRSAATLVQRGGWSMLAEPK